MCLVPFYGKTLSIPGPVGFPGQIPQTIQTCIVPQGTQQNVLRLQVSVDNVLASVVTGFSVGMFV